VGGAPGEGERVGVATSRAAPWEPCEISVLPRRVSRTLATWMAFAMNRGAKEQELEEIRDQVSKLPKLTEQLEGFRSLGIEQRLATAPLLARERGLAERAKGELQRWAESLEALRDGLPDLAFLSDAALQGLPNAALLLPVRQALEALRTEALQQVQGLTDGLTRAKALLESSERAWAAALHASEGELEKALGSLPNLAGKSGREIGTAYRQLTHDIERIRPLEAKREALDRLVASLAEERANMLAELSDRREQRAKAIRGAASELSAELRGKLRIQARPEANRSGLRDFLVTCGLDGVGEKRLAWVVDTESVVTPAALARGIREGRECLVAAYGLPPTVAAALAAMPRANILELEAIELEDVVVIELNVGHAGEEQYRPLDKLSVGQQCTAILHLLLLKNRDPLIVDQPEDNLDNAFIAELIVKELRSAKESRQFVFATHNANIPVFGDAEWIGVFSASAVRATMDLQHQGSIDVPEIRDAVASLLEGGKDAFLQRKNKYGY
jgi:hypothetical protein